MDDEITIKRNDRRKSEDMVPEEMKTAEVLVPDWRHSKRLRVFAFLVGLSLSSILVLSLYLAGVFGGVPELPETMEGEAEFLSQNGEMEIYHIEADFGKKIVQLSLIGSMGTSYQSSQHLHRRLLSLSQNVPLVNAAKIVVQDYSKKRTYFIIPKKNENSTTKCVYSRLEGDIIPRDLLKHATLKTEIKKGNLTHSHFVVDNNMNVDVYRARGRGDKIYEVFIRIPNGTLHLRSKEKGVNFTELESLDCYKYIDKNSTIEESFFESNTSKLFYNVDESLDTQINESISQLLNEYLPNNKTNATRFRRGFGSRKGGVDWWYGNWCGPYQGGYEENPNPACKSKCYKSSSYITSACRSCLPPVDGLDNACMEHDRCLVAEGPGPKWCQPQGNRCTCDFKFTTSVATQIFSCGNAECTSNALQAFVFFKKFLSCWFPVKTCFPSLSFTCGCKWCKCPKLSFSKKCISYKLCAPFGSGEVWW